MAGWTKRRFQAEPVTECPPGPNLERLQASLSGVVILALDVSGSMSGSRLEQARRGCRQFVNEAVADGYSVGVILWHQGINAISRPERSPRNAVALLEAARAGGGNDFVPTLREAHAVLMAMPAADRVLAVFGDGDLGNKLAAIAASKPLIADNIRIITCGLGDASAAQLDVISTEKAGSPRSAGSETIADSIASMARGLMRKA